MNTIDCQTLCGTGNGRIPGLCRGSLYGAVLYLLVALAVGSAARADEPARPSFHGYPITEVYTTEDYGQHDQNWDVLPAPNGLIQVANGNGLMEWDGESWRTYPTPKRSRLRELTRWTDGRIYSGTPNDLGYYEVSEAGGLAYVSLLAGWAEDERNFGEVWSVASNSRWVVFSTVDRLFVYDGDELRTVPDYAPGAHRVFSVDDRIVLRQRDTTKLVALIDDDGLGFEVLSAHLPAETYPMAVYADGDGWLIVSAVDGIYRIDGAGRSLVQAPEAFGDDVVVFSSFIDTDGYHYLGTLKDGLFVIDPRDQLIRNFRADDGLGTSTILSIAADGQGNLWLGGTPVVTRMVPTHRYSRHVTEDNSLALTVVARHQDRLFVGGLGFYEMSASENPLLPPAFRLVEGMGNFQVWEALSVGNDLLLAMNGGVVRARPGDGPVFVEQEVIASSEFAYDVERVGEQDLFFAATHDGLHRIERREDGSWRDLPVSGVARAMRHVAVESADVVWVAGEDARLVRVSGIDPESGDALVETFDRDDGLGDVKVFLLMLDGALLVGSSRGLLTYRPGQVPAFQPSERHAALFAEPEPELGMLQADSAGRIWYQVDGRGLLARPAGTAWAIDDQLFARLPNRRLEAIFEYADDQLWLVYDEVGLHTVDLAALMTTTAAPELQIRAVHDLDTDDPYYLGYGEPALPLLDQTRNSLRIRYALPDFRSGSAVVYRSRLIGSGADRWSEWTTESRKDYTLLGGGRYRFEVEARDSAGRASGPAILPFSVQPPWYASRAAVLTYFLAGMLVLALAAAAGSRWRKRQALAKQVELRQLVRERTAALARANRKLEKLANSDGLTGLANRRLLNARLSELADAATQCALILIDVDHFKAYNDTHGHLAGDDLLKALTDVLLRQNLPDDALIARYGGEEFAIVLPELSEAAAIAIAGSLRSEVQEALRVTVSMGVSERRLSSGDDVNALIGAADAGLYAAKSGGRNQVISRAS